MGRAYGDFELIVSDNASTDGTEAICREFAVRDRRVRFIRQDTNHGAAWNYNYVFSECSSPFFRWAAADDLIAPTCFARCLETLQAAPEAVLCYPRALIIDESGNVLREHDDLLDLRSSRPYVRLRRQYLNVVLGNAMFGIVRSDVLRRTRGHGSYRADYVLLRGTRPGRTALGDPRQAVPSPRARRHVPSRAPESGRVDIWLDPEVNPVSNESSRLSREYIAAIGSAERTRRERVLSYAFPRAGLGTAQLTANPCAALVPTPSRRSETFSRPSGRQACAPAGLTEVRRRVPGAGFVRFLGHPEVVAGTRSRASQADRDVDDDAAMPEIPEVRQESLSMLP